MMMSVIPVTLADSLTPGLSQRALEAVAVEAYRSQLISATEVQQMLHLPSRLAADAFFR